jgi:ribosomal protein S27E
MTDWELVRNLKAQLYSLNVFCGGCEHSRFVHGDADEHACFFNECSCAGWIAEPSGPKPPRRSLHVA